MAAPPARLGVLALGAGYFLSQFYRSFLAVMSPALEADLGLGDFALSNAQAVWFASFALAQFPVGWALDRFGPRWTTTLLMGVGCSGGAALFALAQAPWMIVAAMGLIGVGVSSVLMASLYLYARLFPARRFAANTALVIGFGALGNVLAAAPLSGMIDALGWRGATLAMAAVSAVVTLAIAALVRDPQRAEAAPGAGGAGFFAGLGAVLALRPLWAILPLMTFSYAATASLRGVWIGPYLADVFG
ncbi:MAG: MFS transporter, partial [Pseudomonadota bacterium]